MRYKYVSHLTDLKDLKHIEWFVLHSQEYEFATDRARTLRDRLQKNIHKKNILYSEIVTDYEELVRHFDNDLYHYQFELTGEDPDKWLFSNIPVNYFVPAEDKDGGQYTVPYQYIVENRINYDFVEMSKRHTQLLSDSQKRAESTFQAVQDHYMRYWVGGGVRDALDRYQGIRYGSDYHILRTVLLFVLYNILLGIALQESQFIGILTHPWQLISTEATAQFAPYNLFTGHRVLGIIAFLLVLYFVFMDAVYAYGIYYMIYMKQKYGMVKKYHEEVLRLLEPFQKDFEQCRKGITGPVSKIRNRDSVYIPLIRKVSRGYDFTSGKMAPAEKGETPQPLLQSVRVPVPGFYTRPIHKCLIGLVIALIFITAICNPYNMILF